MRGHSVSQARRDAISAEVNLKDLAEVVAGVRWSGNVCSCCFHGRDSKPSMYYYPDTNLIFCFGCPPKNQRFDPVWFVVQTNGWSMGKSARWLEKEYKIADFVEDDDDDDDDDVDDEYFTYEETKDQFLPWIKAADKTVIERLSIRKEYWEASRNIDDQYEVMWNAMEVVELAKLQGMDAASDDVNLSASLNSEGSCLVAGLDVNELLTEGGTPIAAPVEPTKSTGRILTGEDLDALIAALTLSSHVGQGPI